MATEQATPNIPDMFALMEKIGAMGSDVKNIKTTVTEVLEHVKKTNGRVNRLEDWQITASESIKGNTEACGSNSAAIDGFNKNHLALESGFKVAQRFTKAIFWLLTVIIGLIGYLGINPKFVANVFNENIKTMIKNEIPAAVKNEVGSKLPDMIKVELKTGNYYLEQ